MTITFVQAVGGPVPGFEFEILLRGGGGLPDAAEYRDIYVLAEIDPGGGGTASAGDVTSTPFGSASDGIAWFGSGSPGANMVAQIFQHRNSEVGVHKGAVYGAALAESAGVAATQTLTFATSASAAGTWVFRVGGHLVEVPVNSGDDATAQAAAFVVAYNKLDEHQKPPVGATSALGVVTLTANGKGAHYNTIGLETVTDPDISTTATWGAAAMAGGTLYPTLTTTLANLLSIKTPVIVCPYNEFADGSGANEDIKNHVIAKSSASEMLGSTAIFGSIDTVANLVTDASNLDQSDSERCCLVGVTGCGTWVGEIVAKFAAVNGAEPHLARSLDYLALSDIDIPDVGDVPTKAEQKTLLLGGVTPLAYKSGDRQERIVRAVSTRIDYGEIDWALMTVLDYVRDACAADLQNKFSRCSLVADNAEKPNVEHVKQPRDVRAALKAKMLELQDDGYLTEVETYWESITEDVDLTSGTYNIAIPLRMVDQWHNTRVRLDHEVG